MNNELMTTIFVFAITGLFVLTINKLIDIEAKGWKEIVRMMEQKGDIERWIKTTEEKTKGEIK